MDKVTTVGIDLAKRVFVLHGVDAVGRVVLRKTVRREQFVEVVAGLPPCRIGMEACAGAHEWARRFTALGHGVRLMAAKFVLPYRKNGKNDGNVAEAICEAVGRPSMRFVPVKSAEQQAVLALHRTRQGFITERTAVINRIRALLTEFGVILPQRPEAVRRQASGCAEGLPVLARRMVEDLRSHLALLSRSIRNSPLRTIEISPPSDNGGGKWKSESARRLMQIRGIGPLTALAIVATVGNARDFVSGRQFTAWLGLTPRQHSSGGKSRLGHITKRGDAYLRGLLVQGARATLHTAMRHTDRISRWALSVQQRRGYRRALVAIAAKNARIAWALLSKNESLRPA